MKVNYPIKYTIMPIVEQVGWSHGLNELERNYDTVCYIVSKCYLLRDTMVYKENGKGVREYEVVFPFQRKDGSLFERVNPSYNLYSNRCTNSNIVELVFDTYEEAFAFANKKNKELCEKTWTYLPYNDNFEETVQKKIFEFNTLLGKYKLLENQILYYTEDLEPTKERVCDNVVKLDSNDCKLMNSNLYEYMKFSGYTDYIIYCVSKKDYEQIKLLCETNDADIVYSIIKLYRPAMYKKRKDNIIRFNDTEKEDYYIDDSMYMRKSDKKLSSMEQEFSINLDTEIIITSESIEDIYNSYKNHDDIDMSKINGPIYIKK